MPETPYPKALERFPRLRQSLLASFDDCGLTTKYDLDYAYLPREFMSRVREDGSKGDVDWSTHPQGRGQLTHRTLAKCLEEMAAQQEGHIEVDVALAILLEVLRQADVPDNELVSVPMREVNDIYWIVKKWAHETTWNIANLVDVEQRLERELRYPHPDGGTVPRTLSGQVDAVFVEGADLEHAIVLDWKDTWAMPGPSEISEGGFFQQRFYAWLVMRNYPSISRVTLREFYVRYSEAREATVYRENIDDIEGELAALAERFDRTFESEAWKPSPGKHCSWCLSPTTCPIFPRARGVGRIESQEEAEKVAAQLLVAQAAAGQTRDALKAWVDKHGPTRIRDAKGNRVYGYQPGQRTARPEREEAERAIRDAGGDPEKVDWGSLYKTATSTRFGPHIPKPQIESDDDIVEKLRLSVQEVEERRERAA